MIQMKHFLSMAALAIVGTIMSSCSSSDEIAKTTQPESKTITQTITVNQDADAAGTRAVDPTTGVKTFVADDKIWVLYKQSDNLVDAVTSTACTLSDGGKRATFTVTFSDPKTDSPIRIVYPISWQKSYPHIDFNVNEDTYTISPFRYEEQDGTIDGEKGLNKHALAVYDGALIGTDLPTNAMLKNRGTILALTIQNADGSADITSTIGKLVIQVSGESRDYTITPPSPATTFPDAPIYVAMRPVENKDITFTAYYGAGNANSVTKTVTSRTLARNNIYPVNLRMGTAKSLASLTGNYVAQDGDWLTGTLTGEYMISVADGATVTLSGITINGGDDWNTDWSGITCEGDATLVLADGTTNLVKPFCRIRAAISVADGKTLTIQGSGSLTADSHSVDVFSAGIGGNAEDNSGNIVITGAANVTAYGGGGAAAIGCGRAADEEPVAGGDITISTTGTVTAYGGANAAGIGAGISSNQGTNSCGNILITKGTIVATGGRECPGIGAGRSGDKASTCGTVTITDGVTKVTATRGANSGDGCSIGPTSSRFCGTVTIGGTIYWGPEDSAPTQYEYKNGGETYLRADPLIYEP